MVQTVTSNLEDDATMLAKKYKQDIVCIVAWDAKPVSGAVSQVISFGATPVYLETAKQMGVSIKSLFGWRNPQSSTMTAKKINRQLRERGGSICCDCWHTKFTVSTKGDECYVTCGKCGKSYSVYSRKEI